MANGITFFGSHQTVAGIAVGALPCVVPRSPEAQARGIGSGNPQRIGEWAGPLAGASGYSCGADQRPQGEGSPPLIYQRPLARLLSWGERPARFSAFAVRCALSAAAPTWGRDETLPGSHMIDTPASLLYRLSQDPAGADWERFVRLFTPLLFRWAGRLGFAEHQADDLLQDVFLILLRRLPEFRYDPERSFRAWLWTVFRHAALSILQRRQPRPVDEQALAMLASPDESEQIDEAEYRRYLVERALMIVRADFPESTWRVFQLLVVEDRPGVEVAQTLGITPNAVYLARSRVMARLREELAGLDH